MVSFYAESGMMYKNQPLKPNNWETTAWEKSRILELLKTNNVTHTAPASTFGPFRKNGTLISKS